jgi:hypothetical protein
VRAISSTDKEQSHKGYKYRYTSLYGTSRLQDVGQINKNFDERKIDENSLFGSVLGYI